MIRHRNQIVLICYYAFRLPAVSSGVGHNVALQIKCAKMTKQLRRAGLQVSLTDARFDYAGAQLIVAHSTCWDGIDRLEVADSRHAVSSEPKFLVLISYGSRKCTGSVSVKMINIRR